MAEREQSLFVTTCKGTLQNLKEPVTISIAHNVIYITPTVACPFAKSVLDDKGDRSVRCVAPIPEVLISDKKALKTPVCYQLERKWARL